jgi:hypothetical protein
MTVGLPGRYKSKDLLRRYHNLRRAKRAREGLLVIAVGSMMLSLRSSLPSFAPLQFLPPPSFP